MIICLFDMGLSLKEVFIDFFLPSLTQLKKTQVQLTNPSESFIHKLTGLSPHISVLCLCSYINNPLHV